MPLSTILSENRQYWTGRSAGYSKVNRTELSTDQRKKWKSCLKKEITNHFPATPFEELRVLDVGTGPGFFAILLCEMGLSVTAVDLTPAMLPIPKRPTRNGPVSCGPADSCSISMQTGIPICSTTRLFPHIKRTESILQRKAFMTPT